MTGSRRGPGSRRRHGTEVRRPTDDIKEQLKASLQRRIEKYLKKKSGYHTNAVRDASRGAGLDDTTAARFHEMAFYAAYAVDASVRKSGQSAFTWVPLQSVTHCALDSVPDAEKPAFTQSFIDALTGLLKHVEDQDKPEELAGPRDLAKGSTIIHNIMGGINKVLRVAVSGSGYGRARSLRLTADSVAKTVEAMQLSSGVNSREVEEPYKQLVAELAAAQRLEARANHELLDAKPVNGLSPSLKATAEAVYAHQGPEIQRDVAELQRVILDARQILDTATEHLQKASVDTTRIVREAEQANQEHSARKKGEPCRRLRRPSEADQAGDHADEHHAVDEGFGEAAQNADPEQPGNSEPAAELLQHARPSAARARRPRKARRDRDRHRSNREHGDGTERREAATDAEDEEEVDAADGEVVQAAGPAAESSAPAPTSPQSSMAEPPGFSPARAPGKPAQDDELQENGLHFKRTKKRSGRRERERQARHAHAAHQEQEADRPAPAAVAAAFRDGFRVQGSKHAWAEDVLFEEESKPQRRKRERGRRSMGSENVAPEAAEAELCAQANAHSSDVAHVFQEAQARSEQQRRPDRRSKIRQIKEVVQALATIRRDLSDPVTQVPLTNPVVAADGYTYERSSIQKHLATSRISPISGEPISNTLYPNTVVATILTQLNALPQLGA